MSSYMEDREKGETVVAKLLIIHISNKATGMLNKSEPLEAYPSGSFHVKLDSPIGMNLGVAWMHGTSSKHR